MIETRVCVKCGDEKPLDYDHFKPQRGGKNANQKGWRKKCRLCVSAESKARMEKVGAENRAAYAVMTKAICVDCPGKGAQPIENFSRRPNGQPFKRCKVCKARWNRIYRHTERGRRSLQRSRKSCYGKAKKQRWNKEYRRRQNARLIAKNRKEAHIVRARNLLRRAILKGRIVVPDRCAMKGCRRKPPRWKLRAWFNRGHDHPYDVTFYCYPCEWLVRHMAEVEREKAETERDRRRLHGVFVTHDEWKEIHEDHVRALATEEPVPLEPFYGRSTSRLTNEQIMASPFVQRWLNHVPDLNHAAHKQAHDGYDYVKLSSMSLWERFTEAE